MQLRDFIRRKAFFLRDTVLKSADIRQDYRCFLPCLAQKSLLCRCRQFCLKSMKIRKRQEEDLPVFHNL